MNPDQLKTASEIKRANTIGKTMSDDVWGKLPNLSKIDTGNNFTKVADAVFTQFADDLSRLVESIPRHVMAAFEPRTLRIMMNTRKVKNYANTLKIGSKNWHVGADVASTYRHEYGHWLYELGGGRNLSSAGTGAKQDAFRAWNRFYNKSWKWDESTKRYVEDVSGNVLSGKKGFQIFGDDVSHYAATDANEAFAECFSAYTSPLYGKAGKRLPEQIEKLLENIIGKRTDL